MNILIPFIFFNYLLKKKKHLNFLHSKFNGGGCRKKLYIASILIISVTVEVSIKQLNNGDSLKAQMVDQLVQKSIEQLSRNCD